jgi:16S rRNA (guanine527-N7)-methyltransferase
MGQVFDQVACRDRLRQGMHSLGLALDTQQEQRLLQYLVLLLKWNQAYNLTAVRDPLEMVGRHLLDSLAVLPYLTGGRCLDMGTGAGLPGIPMAVMRPDMQFVLLDSNGKKIRFVRQVVLELGLKNVETVHERLENYRPARDFDMLISRALTSLTQMLALTTHLRTGTNVLLAMKADVEAAALAELPDGCTAHLIPIEVPYVEGSRNLVHILQNLDARPS